MPCRNELIRRPSRQGFRHPSGRCLLRLRYCDKSIGAPSNATIAPASCRFVVLLNGMAVRIRRLPTLPGDMAGCTVCMRAPFEAVSGAPKAPAAVPFDCDAQDAAARAGQVIAYQAIVSNFDAELRVVSANLGTSVIPRQLAARYEKLGDRRPLR